MAAATVHTATPNMDDATKARLHLLWTELSRLVERAEADDGSDDEDAGDADLTEEITACCDQILSVLPGDSDALTAKVSLFKCLTTVSFFHSCWCSVFFFSSRY